MKALLRLCLVLLLAALAGGFWIWREAQIFLNTPSGTKGQQEIIDVPPGARLNKIADELAARGLISSARNFILLARWKKQANRLQAGRFALEGGWKPEQVLEALVNGRPVLQRITVPEGLTWWQTGRLLESEGLVRFDDFCEVIADPAFLRHYGIPFATAEGFLMPDTYLLKPPDASAQEAGGEAAQAASRAQARAVAGRMIDNFWRKTAQLWPNGGGHQGLAARPGASELKKWVTLASIVEKETGIANERARVAGVYENRLKKGMLLQADPTVIYGLGPAFDGNLKRVHLEDAANPYNTYQRPGLPPGPISSFGTAALASAIQPEQHDFLYFVAKTDGGEHQFSATLQEHNRAVRDYLRQRRTAPRGTPTMR